MRLKPPSPLKPAGGTGRCPAALLTDNMHFVLTSLVLFVLLAGFYWASFYRPVVAYCGMYPLAAFAAVWLLLTVGRPKPTPDRSATAAARRSRRTGTLALGCVGLAILCWSLLVSWERRLPRNLEDAAATLAIVAFCFAILLTLRWLRLREMMVADPDAPRCIGCGYSLKGLTEPRCPECGRPFDA